MSEANKPAETAAVETEQKKGKKKVKRTVGQEILSWVLTILVAVVAALVIRSVIFEPVRVDGESMDDTLANGEMPAPVFSAPAAPFAASHSPC